jgi:hypothetical protein
MAMLVIVFGLLAGLYYSLRYGSWAMETDASSMTTSALGMIDSGELLYDQAYNNGYAYPALLSFTSLISGVDVRIFQLFSSLWVFVVALAAFISYREFLGSSAAAALGMLLLFMQPDFLFYIVRGSHEKFIWASALLMLFLLARSFNYLHQPRRLLVFVVLFYLVFWAFVAGNVYFGASFMSAILLSLVGGWLLSRLRRKETHVSGDRSKAMQRLIMISLTCFMLVYIMINYAYPPAMQFYSLFTTMLDKVGLVVLGGQEAAAPASYQVAANTWRSQWSYLALTGWQWLIALLSLLAWGIGLVKLTHLDQKRWLLWLLYSASGVLLAYGVVADLGGFMSANMQVRMFTSFALFSSPLVADLVAQRLRRVRPSRRSLAGVAGVLLLVVGAGATLLKVTNDPSFGNQWFFYSPAELAPSPWLRQHQVERPLVWLDIQDHLASAYYFWEGERPYTWERYLYGSPQSVPHYILISEAALLRANRSGISLPATGEHNRIYDNGPVQLYHRRALTPYQR